MLEYKQKRNNWEDPVCRCLQVCVCEPESCTADCTIDLQLAYNPTQKKTGPCPAYCQDVDRSIMQLGENN